MLNLKPKEVLKKSFCPPSQTPPVPPLIQNDLLITSLFPQNITKFLNEQDKSKNCESDFLPLFVICNQKASGFNYDKLQFSLVLS